MAHTESEALTAEDFLGRELAGCTVADASRATGISYQTIHAAKHGARVRSDTAKALQDWSVKVGAQHGVYISAAKTLGFSEPTASEIRAAKAAGA
jgi:hypothetical protein